MIHVYQYSRAWYCNPAGLQPGTADEVMIQLRDDAGEFVEEFAVRWLDIGTERLEPQLQVFSDGLQALSATLHTMAPLLDASPTADQFVAGMIAAGAVDATPTEAPQ